MNKYPLASRAYVQTEVGFLSVVSVVTCQTVALDACVCYASLKVTLILIWELSIIKPGLRYAAQQTSEEVLHAFKMQTKHESAQQPPQAGCKQDIAACNKQISRV